MKKVFTGFVVGSAVIYFFVLYYMLFRLVGRQMVIMSDHMLDNYNYWNSVNLIPFNTIAQYVMAAVDGGTRSHALLNLFGNMFLFFPAGFYLPFFVKKASKTKIYGIIVAVVIIAIEIIQLVTMTGSLDIDDFILNFAGAIIGFMIFKLTPLRGLFNLCAW